MTVKEMREKRSALAAEAISVAQSDPEKFNKIMTEVDALKGSIDRAERAEALEAELRQTVRPPLEQVNGAENRGSDGTEERKDFRNYLRTGRQTRTYTPMSDAVEGAYIVPQGFASELEIALKAYGGVRSVARILSTSTGNPLFYPTANDTNNIGEQLGENNAAGQANPSFSNVQIKGWTYSTKMVNVSNQLLQDSAFDVEAFLREQFVNRLGRIQNQKFTTGAGTTEPLGINTAASAGPTSAVTLQVSYEDLVELEHSVDRAYRPGAKFMLRDSVLKQIKKQKDAQGHPLWVPGIAQNMPDRILGYQYVINDDMPSVTSGNNLMLFGALDKYLIRDVRGLGILRLNERYGELFQTAFLGFARADGALIDAGTHPVKSLVSL